MEDHNDDAISSSEASRLRWHVFLSFRGEDTRYPFINNLYTTLHNKGIRAFRDDDGLRRGDEIAPTLLDAIEESAASIVVISQNYASSRWCLEELSKICECKRLILPVFYLVDPSDVRKQRGPFFGKHFREHEEKGIEKEKVTKWREAMETAGGKAGFVFQDKDRDSNEAQAKLIQLLVKRVLEELDSTPLDVAPYTVGLDSRIEKLKSLLDVRSNGVRVLALHGMGGVGKTTLAKALYNKLVGSFECLVFMKNDRENSETDDDLVYLQNKLVNHLSPGKPPVYRIDSGISAIKAMVHEKQVLVILDDIRNVRQLEVLVGRDWFSEGSRIIITTRDSEVLPKHLVNEFYEVIELAPAEALQLFSYHALRREKPTERFMNLSKKMVSLTGGLPLALEVFGSFLFERWRIEEWKDALQKLERIRPRNLQDVLKISYDGLDVQEQCIFLDLACLFIKKEIEREDILDALKGCGFRAEIAITVLRARSLIKVFEDNSLWMHDQIRDMGRQIVLDESPVYPGMRSRLWDRDEIMTVLKGEKVSLRNMFSLSMPGSKIPDWFSQEVVKFSERKNLRIKGVIIGVIVSFSHQIPDNLRDQDPLLTGIRANIVKLNRPVFNAMLDIKNVPKTHEDHLYLSRFPEWHPLSFSLKDDYKIHVTIDDPPYIEGLKLKKWGVHLVFEGDDDYDGNEESLDETQLSISEKLAKFFSFLEEEEDHIPESGFEVESQVQEIEEQEEIEREPHWWQFLWLFRRCFCF